jgi:hypothetical protein
VALKAPIIAWETPVLCRGETADGADGVSRTAAHAHAGVWAGVTLSEPTLGPANEVSRCTIGFGAGEISAVKGPARL